jgi:hypothetical protein
VLGGGGAWARKSRAGRGSQEKEKEEEEKKERKEERNERPQREHKKNRRVNGAAGPLVEKYGGRCAIHAKTGLTYGGTRAVPMREIYWWFRP